MLGLIEARVSTRRPAAYLVNRAYIQGEPFYVDERVIVPRSLIGELLFGGLIGEGALIGDPGAVRKRSICARAAARWRSSPRGCFPTPKSTRSICPRMRWRSPHATSRRMISAGASIFIRAIFRAVGARRYDVILTNPPYVETARMSAFPPEFAAEPPLAHDGGADGLAIVRRILRAAPTIWPKVGRWSAKSAAAVNGWRRNSRPCRWSGSTPRRAKARCFSRAPPTSPRRQAGEKRR